MSKHTPGPWKTQMDLNEIAEDDICWVYSMADENLVADTYTTFRSREEIEANALLIAAAPRMYAELKKIIHNWDGEPEDMMGAMIAIASVEGEPDENN